MAFVIAVENDKGGVGKTTTTKELARGLSKLGHKTLLIDEDESARITKRFIREKRELYYEDILLQPTLELVKKTIVNIDENLDIIPSSNRLKMVRREIEEIDKPQQYLLKNMIRLIEDDYDVILIDCGPDLSVLTINALLACDLVIIPVKIDIDAIDGLDNMMTQIDNVNNNYGLEIPYKILFTMVKQNNIIKDVVNQVFARFSKDKMLHQMIRYQDKPVTAAGFYRTYIVDNMKAAVGYDYRLLVEEVEQIINNKVA